MYKILHKSIDNTFCVLYNLCEGLSAFLSFRLGGCPLSTADMVKIMEFFDMSNRDFWIRIISIIISFFGIIVSITLFVIKNKWKKSSSLFQGGLELLKMLCVWIVEAEAHTNYTGIEKLQYVMNLAFRYCTINKIVYNEEELKSEVESLISFSKNVNADETRKEQKLNPLLTGEK